MPITFSQTKSTKERILENIKTTLEGIKIANGYANDVQKVVRFRIAGWQTLEFPTIMVVGVKESKKGIEGGPSRMDTDLTVEIQSIYTNDPVDDSEEKHNLLLRDIEAALQVDVQRGGNARDTTVVGTDFEVVEAQVPYCVSTLTAVVRFQHGREDPTRAF